MGKTAYLWDRIFLEHKTEWGHPERPERLSAIDKKLSAAPYYKDLVRIQPKKADYRHIELVHERSYILRVKDEIEGGTEYLDSMDTSVCARSFEVALYAVGGCLNMCDAVMKGDAARGFCAVRPPGHHAERDYAAGFCIFNNIAIAARYLQTEHGLGRIAIVDWDVHHGNGTQHSFENDRTILYTSLHQYPYYPGTGSVMEKGKGAGEGFTLNVPMDAGSGDDEYLAAFKDVIVTQLEKFEPEMLLISAGFDAHRSDPLSSIQLSTETFYQFTKMLLGVAKKHCKGRVIACLEGGYNLNALADSVERVMSAFVEE
jgi:acetoin utilization deacetylase AcuC-like enzyme